MLVLLFSYLNQLSINPEISDVSTNLFSFIFLLFFILFNLFFFYFTHKFTIIRSSKIFCLEVWYFCIIMFSRQDHRCWVSYFQKKVRALLVASNTRSFTFNLNNLSIIIYFFNKPTNISYFLICVMNFLYYTWFYSIIMSF